ncbi:TetR/AcrR family transcriptional regulator [Pseudokineococcus lusitanus]|uniref:TetR family transcriptional regulator n=1 Tax=Pseudokineococcus lusitanus TaxID=763993 RepID=A0A3N1GW60_9ACTN|nr:TetR/AcrR family transcriptional regulator [Pseudokineococcus lusitanus]ROP34510.1 TetR family transcriptional regulator [Pseudokineococcus lusitanus]
MSAAPSEPRRRDAAETRRLLVAAARRRFAQDGYQGTTVRDVAADAGVNVALINRYFTSKEGLFEACLPRTLAALDAHPDDLGAAVDRVVRRLVAATTDEEVRVPLLLLLRSSGDARADELRRTTLRGFAERLAAAAAREGGRPADEGLLLRAEMALGVLLGTVVLRTSVAVEPLASTDAGLLEEPLRAAVLSLLRPTAD